MNRKEVNDWFLKRKDCLFFVKVIKDCGYSEVYLFEKEHCTFQSLGDFLVRRFPDYKLLVGFMYKGEDLVYKKCIENKKKPFTPLDEIIGYEFTLRKIIRNR